MQAFHDCLEPAVASTDAAPSPAMREVAPFSHSNYSHTPAAARCGDGAGQGVRLPGRQREPRCATHRHPRLTAAGMASYERLRSRQARRTPSKKTTVHLRELGSFETNADDEA